MMNYWEECILEAFEDAGISATDEQINIVVEWISGAHENYGMAHGYDAIPNPLITEIKNLKNELKKEKNKTICKECNGKGSVISHGPYHYSESNCHYCNGTGFKY
jgi:hypothetical protein